MDPPRLIPGDASLIENIVNYLKAKGIFDEFRHECLADVDTKSSCQNLSQRVDGYTSKFLANETWHPDLNKNELRNKLRRNIDESGMLAVGADHVVEQVINPKIHQLFLPKIIEVVHQYVKEQTELLNKKPGTVASNENAVSVEKPVTDISDSKDKTSISDPIADILSFGYSKSKPTPAINTNVKTENIQHKHTDPLKVEKKKEEKIVPVVEKSSLVTTSENSTSSVVTEVKPQVEKEKEKIKKEELEIPQEVSKKVVKDEVKSEKKKTEEVKTSLSETAASGEESKTNVSTSIKPTVLFKKDVDKNKQKVKSVNTQKSSNSSSEVKKSKKEPSDKSSEKHVKSKPPKSSKESPSPIKIFSSLKNMLKEEKGESSKSKAYDSSSSKTSESSMKKSKSSSSKKDSSSLKHKVHSEKTDKSKISKSADKTESSIHHDSSNSEKGAKNVHYSSSYDSSQGSDQEKSSSSSSKKERQKHFSKHVKKEEADDSSKTSLDKKGTKDSDENSSKKHKSEKDLKHKLKETIVIEAAKISSRSNSFGSTSSVSSSSNTSKDNLVSNSDEVSESSVKGKNKKQSKEKDSCQNPSKTLPPPPPPPPPSSLLSCELTSSAEMSSVEDTQSSSDSETSSSDEISEESSSDSELESKDLILNTLNESMLNSSTDNINAFYDIFLYSSSSSEFEGYGDSPEKKKVFKETDIRESEISMSSVHTSDLSSYDDELSSDDGVPFLTGGVKKRLTLKEAQDLIQNKAILRDRNKNVHSEDKTYAKEVSLNEGCIQKSSSFLSSEDESSPSEPKRSLRRERKLNPRYASSEYTSIFNSRKETFITKQSSPPVKNHSSDSFPNNTERKYRENSLETKINTVLIDNFKKSEKNKAHLNAESQGNASSSCSEMSDSDEVNSIMDKEKLFRENDVSDNEKLKLCLKPNQQNNSQLNRNSYSLKRKLEVTESTQAKRPCSRSSVDSSSSEFVPNENKPFNSEKQNFEEKVLKDCNLKGSNLSGGIKKDLFCKQRTNNNGDILGQKDIFSKNGQAKTINNSEKKSESDSSKELNSL